MLNRENNQSFDDELYQVTMETLAIESITYLVSSLDSCNINTKRIDTTALLELCADMSAHVYAFLSDQIFPVIQK